jgi:hypothetical protein
MRVGPRKSEVGVEGEIARWEAEFICEGVPGWFGITWKLAVFWAFTLKVPHKSSSENRTK